MGQLSSCTTGTLNSTSCHKLPHFTGFVIFSTSHPSVYCVIHAIPAERATCVVRCVWVLFCWAAKYPTCAFRLGWLFIHLLEMVQWSVSPLNLADPWNSCHAGNLSIHGVLNIEEGLVFFPTTPNSWWRRMGVLNGGWQTAPRALHIGGLLCFYSAVAGEESCFLLSSHFD